MATHHQRFGIALPYGDTTKEVVKKEHRVCPRVCLTEERQKKPNEYETFTIQFKRRRGTIYRDEKAPDQKIWGFFVDDWLMRFSTEEITSKQ